MIKKLAIYLDNEMKRQGIRSSIELSKRCGNRISPDFINKIKRNTPQTVTIDTLTILADGLNLTLKELLIKSEIIDPNDEYGLSLEDSKNMIETLSPILKVFNINSSKLNKLETLELANRIYDYIETISHLYQNDK